jgi:hypothetical protein
MLGPEEPAEIHTIFHGFYNGLSFHAPESELEETEGETHYYRFGYLVGRGAWFGAGIVIGTML